MSDRRPDSSTETPTTDGSERTAYTIRLELEDEPGSLHHALGPIADHGGNLRSIHHERGNRTPRGNVPVEIDLACSPEGFDALVADLRAAGVTVIQAGPDQYDERVSVVLTGDGVGVDLGGALSAIDATSHASVVSYAVSAPAGIETPVARDAASARLTLATERGRRGEALAAVGAVADEHGLDVITPLAEVSGG